MKITYVCDSNGNLVSKDLTRDHTPSIQSQDSQNCSLLELRNAARVLISHGLEKLLSDPTERNKTAKYQIAFLDGFDTTPINELWDTNLLAGVNVDNNPPNPVLNPDFTRACVCYGHSNQVLDLLTCLTIKEGVHLYNYQNRINTTEKTKRARESFCELFYQKHPTHSPEADELYKEILERAKYYVAAKLQDEFEGFEVLFQYMLRKDYNKQNLKTPTDCDSKVLDKAFTGLTDWLTKCVQNGRINKEHFLKLFAWSSVPPGNALRAAVQTICNEEERLAGRVKVTQGTNDSFIIDKNCEIDELFPFLSDPKYLR